MKADTVCSMPKSRHQTTMPCFYLSFLVFILAFIAVLIIPISRFPAFKSEMSSLLELGYDWVHTFTLVPLSLKWVVFLSPSNNFFVSWQPYRTRSNIHYIAIFTFYVNFLGHAIPKFVAAHCSLNLNFLACSVFYIYSASFVTHNFYVHFSNSTGFDTFLESIFLQSATYSFLDVLLTILSIFVALIT